jgi:hypothetical protein
VSTSFDLQALHRVPSRLVGQRTAIVNQIPGPFLLERGIAVRQGLRFLRHALPDIIANRTDVLTPRSRRASDHDNALICPHIANQNGPKDANRAALAPSSIAAIGSQSHVQQSFARKSSCVGRR